MIKINDTEISGLYIGSTEATKAYLGDVLIYEKGGVDYSKEYFTIEMLEDGLVGWGASGITYSKDDGATWNAWNNQDTYAISAYTGDKIMLRGSINGNSNFITSSGRFNVYGNAMSLTLGDNFSGQTGGQKLQELFFGCDNLINAENLVLPASTAATNCYESMFSGCHNLETAPKTLPALTVQTYAYRCMFQYCTSLVKAPILPATTTQSYAYYAMFDGCRSLNYVKCLGENLGLYATEDWLKNVSATGTFVKSPNKTWSTGANGIPNGWTIVDA